MMAAHSSTWLGIRRSALLEIVGFLLLALLLDGWLGAGDRFWQLAPHPFWAIVILVSAHYGTTEGLVAALLSTIALLAGNIPQQPITLDTHAWLMELLRRPLLWFCTAVTLGELRMRQIRERRTTLHKLHAALERERTFTRSYHELKQLKVALELQLAGQLKSSVAVYQAIKHIESFDPMDVLLGVEDIVSAVMSPEKFSVYALGPHGFEAASCFGWGNEDTYQRRFSPDTALYREVAGRQRVLCAINEEDEELLGGEGLLAGPLVDTHSGDMIGMLKIEAMPFMEMNLTNVEIFRTLCEWIGMAYVHANQHQRAQMDSIHNPSTRRYSASFCRLMESYLRHFTQRHRLPFGIVSLRADGMEALPSYRQRRVLYLLEREIDNLLEPSALLCESDEEDYEWRLLLPGYTPQQIAALEEAVVGRLNALDHAPLPDMAAADDQDISIRDLSHIRLHWRREEAPVDTVRQGSGVHGQ